MGSLKKMLVTKLFLLFNLILIVYPMTGGSTGSEDRIILHIHQDNPEDAGADINEVEAGGGETSSWTQSWTEDPSEPKPTWTDRPSWTKRPKWKTTMSWATRRPEWTTRPSYPKRPECGNRWPPCEECGQKECEKSGKCEWKYWGSYGGVCKPIGKCGDYTRECEDCKEKDCEEAGKCVWKEYRPHGTCLPLKGSCGWDCSKCKYKYVCERDDECRWNKWGPKCEKVLRTFPGGK